MHVMDISSFDLLTIQSRLIIYPHVIQEGTGSEREELTSRVLWLEDGPWRLGPWSPNTHTQGPALTPPLSETAVPASRLAGPEEAGKEFGFVFSFLFLATAAA